MVGLCCVLTVILVSVILAVTVTIVQCLPRVLLNIPSCFRCGCCRGRGRGPGTRTAPTTPPARVWTPWSPWPPGTRVITGLACQTRAFLWPAELICQAENGKQMMLNRPELLLLALPKNSRAQKAVPCWLWFASECDYDSVQPRSAGPGVSTIACEAPRVSPHLLSVAPVYSTVGRKIKPPTPTLSEENYLVNSITQRGDTLQASMSGAAISAN